VAKVLLIGINYAPELTGTALNNVAMVDVLRRAGHSVEVMTGVPHYPEWRVRPEYRKVLRKTDRIHGVSVERFRHFVPRRQSALSRGLYELTFAINAAIFRPRVKPDVVIGVIPSLGGGLLARFHAVRSKAVWGVVFSDLVGRAASDAGMPGGRSVSGIVSTLELQIARAAGGVAVITDGFRPYLEGGGVAASRIYRIINLNPSSPPANTTSREMTRKRLAWQTGDVIVLHSGSMGYKQALENVIEAAALAKGEPRYKFVLMGDGNRRDALVKLARRLRLTNVEFRELAAAADYRAVLEAADVLLISQRATVRDMSLPGKLTNYLSAGVPVVAAVASDSASAHELGRSGGAVVVPPENPHALMSAIEKIAAEPTLRQTLAPQSRAYEASTRASADSMNVNGFVDLLLSTKANRKR
jgi:colanic acid biosynthesis glycosyl transferase WcaI